MKPLLLPLLLCIGLSACKSGNDPAPVAADPFLGHWETTSSRQVKYDASGKVAADQTVQIASQLDVTATTLTFMTKQPNGTTSKEVDTYVRNGESITITPGAGGTPSDGPSFVRALNAQSFTLELNGRRTSGQPYYINSTGYHR